MRVARVALFLNAAAASAAVVGMVAGLAPYAAEHPILARKVADRELAGVFVMLFVAIRLRRDPSLIVLPLVFVFLNMADSLYEFALRRTGDNLAPLVFEATFVSIYLVFFASQLRARRASAPAS